MISTILALVLSHALTVSHVQGRDTDTVIIENVNVIPMTSETVLMNRRVLIVGDKIVRIEDASARDTHTVTRRIPARGKYLVPGFSEMHYHFRSNDVESDFKLLLANGITTVRKMAESSSERHAEIRNKIKAGQLPPLNYFSSGPYLTSKDLTNNDVVNKTVKDHKAAGFDFLKIADNLPIETYLKLLDECEANNLPVIGHAQRHQPVEYSLRMKSIEHIEEFLYLSDSSQRPSFFKQADADLIKLAQAIKESGTYIGTTHAVFEFINNCLDDSAFNVLQNHKLVKYLAKNEREGFLTEKNDYRKLRHKEFDGVKASKLFGDYFVWIRKFTRMLEEAGVPLLSGSDTYGMVIVGHSLHNEFALLKEAGIKPYRILLTSTVNPARYLGLYASEGTVTPGKKANLVLLDKNPLEDIRNTQTISGVFLQGKWYDRKKLDGMLSEVEHAFK